MKLIDLSVGNLYVSGMPEECDLEKAPRFNIIWNLAYEAEDICGMEMKFADKVLFANIKDFSAPESKCKSFIYQLNAVADALRLGGTVLIHCFAGHGRTGMAVACVKHLVDNVSIDDALKFAKENCKGPEREVQVNFVKDLLSDVASKS